MCSKLEGELIEEFGEPLFCFSIKEYTMPSKIDYEVLDDHDLLVMAVMQGNDTVKQQEEIIIHLKVLNGTVKSDHAWIGALRWVVLFLFVGLLATLTGQIGLW